MYVSLQYVSMLAYSISINRESIRWIFEFYLACFFRAVFFETHHSALPKDCQEKSTNMSKEDSVPKLELPQDLKELLGNPKNDGMDLDEDEGIPGPPPSSPMANNLLLRKHAKRSSQRSPIATALFRKKFREQQHTPPPPSTTPPFVTPEKKGRASECTAEEFEDSTPSSPMASMMLSRKHKKPTENKMSNRVRFSGALSSQQHNVLDNLNRKGPPSSPFASILMARKRPRKNNSSFTPEKGDSLDTLDGNAYIEENFKECNSPKDVALLVRKHVRNPENQNVGPLSPPPPPSNKVTRTPLPIPFPPLT